MGKVPAQHPGDIYEVRELARTGATELGLREQHKIDKLERIADAAHRLFARNGFDRTTLREIAKEAGVALATLSLYAGDKRDLILVIINKLIPPLLQQGQRNTSATAPLRSNLVALFEPFYFTYAKDPVLYRIVLGQIYSGTTNIHANQNETIRREMLKSIEDLILRATDSGEIASGGDCAIQARSFYYLYFASVRRWLSSDAPDAETGLAELRMIFGLLISGLVAKE